MRARSLVSLHLVIRKGAHVFEYFAFGLLLLSARCAVRDCGWSLRWAAAAHRARRSLTRPRDEFHQVFVPSRSASSMGRPARLLLIGRCDGGNWPPCGNCEVEPCAEPASRRHGTGCRTLPKPAQSGPRGQFFAQPQIWLHRQTSPEGEELLAKTKKAQLRAIMRAGSDCLVAIWQPRGVFKPLI